MLPWLSRTSWLSLTLNSLPNSPAASRPRALTGHHLRRHWQEEDKAPPAALAQVPRRLAVKGPIRWARCTPQEDRVNHLRLSTVREPAPLTPAVAHCQLGPHAGPGAHVGKAGRLAVQRILSTCLPLGLAASRPQPLSQVRLLSKVVLHCMCVERSEARDATDQLRPASMPGLLCMPIGLLMQQPLQNQAAGSLEQGRCWSALGSTAGRAHLCTFASLCGGGATDNQEAVAGLLRQDSWWPAENQRQVHIQKCLLLPYAGSNRCRRGRKLLQAAQSRQDAIELGHLPFTPSRQQGRWPCREGCNSLATEETG